MKLVTNVAAFTVVVVDGVVVKHVYEENFDHVYFKGNFSYPDNALEINVVQSMEMYRVNVTIEADYTTR